MISLVGALWILAQGTNAFALNCDELLKRVLAQSAIDVDAENLQQRTLAQFSAESINLKKKPFWLISGSGVIGVRGENGINYVLRLKSPLNDPFAEKFNANFIKESPHGRTPEVRTLTGYEAYPVIKKIREDKRFWAELAGTYEARMGEPLELRPGEAISLSVFFPKMESGYEYLKNFGPNDKFRYALYRWTLKARGDKKDRFGKLLASLWEKLDDSQKLVFMNDYKKVFPDSKETRFRDFMAFVLSHRDESRIEGFIRLHEMAFEKIPHTVRQQLADYWALYTVLGIPDPSPLNWLIAGEDVLGVDVAFPEQRFSDPGTLSFGSVMQRTPYNVELSAGRYDESMRKRLLSDVSEETRDFIADLSERKLRNIARNSDSHLTDARMAEILKKAKVLSKQFYELSIH